MRAIFCRSASDLYDFTLSRVETTGKDACSDRDTFDMWDITVEDILNVAMVDEEADPTRDLEEPKRLLDEDPHFTKIQLLQDDAHVGVALVNYWLHGTAFQIRISLDNNQKKNDRDI
ncbi:hypothetical protein Tco_0708794 [Tanacetum coccineum]